MAEPRGKKQEAFRRNTVDVLQTWNWKRQEEMEKDGRRKSGGRGPKTDRKAVEEQKKNMEKKAMMIMMRGMRRKIN